MLKDSLNVFIIGLCLAIFLLANSSFAASNTLIPPDSNTGLIVENAVIRDNTTTVLFWTYPEIGNPGAGKDCPLDFYSVALQPGLARVQPVLIAKGVCGNGLSKARLLENGEILLLANGRLERWRDGKNLISTPLTDQEMASMIGIDTNSRGQASAIAANGDVIIATHVAVASNAAGSDPALMLTNLDKDGKTRWQVSIAEPGQRITLGNMWAAKDGSVLLQAGLLPADNSSLTMQGFLYLIDADGKQQKSVQVSSSDEPDLQTLMQGAQANLQQALSSLNESNPEAIKKMDASVLEEGGFDVLFQRESKQEGRGGHFLMRVGPDGSVQNEQDVTAPIVDYGLDQWTDFYVDGRNLVLLSRVLASQPEVQAKRKSYSQNVISSIDLDNHTQRNRLVPLDQRYLQAVMNAGDEEIQYIDNRPGGEPILLSLLGDLPLAISKGYLSRRPALRLDEGTSDLPIYTEAYDQRRNDTSRKQGGNYESIAKAGSKKAATAEQSVPPTVNVQEMNAQIATAMAQAQQGMSPEMAKQVNAALAQVQKEMKAAEMTLPPGMQAGVTSGPGKGTGTSGGSFSMTVKDAFKISGRGVVITGRIERGSISVGDTVCLESARIGSRVLKVESINLRSTLAESAKAGDMPGILVNGIETSDISRDDQLRSSCE